MSGKDAEQQKPEVSETAVNAAGADRNPAGAASRQTGSGWHGLARAGNFPPGEIRDPLGNFSEQVGAYFG